MRSGVSKWGGSDLMSVITYDHTTHRHRKAARRQLFREARRHCSCRGYALVEFCLGPARALGGGSQDDS
eukprot:4553670-Prymnesium_polylepis.1